MPVVKKPNLREEMETSAQEIFIRSARSLRNQISARRWKLAQDHIKGGLDFVKKPNLREEMETLGKFVLALDHSKVKKPNLREEMETCHLSDEFA